MVNDKIDIMFFGIGGTIVYSKKVTSTWRLSTSRFQYYLANGHYREDYVDDCILIDAVDLLESSPHLLFSCPLLNLSFYDSQRENFDLSVLSEAAASSLPYILSIPEVMAALKASTIVGGLAMVSKKIYVDFWSGNGARLGTVKDGKVEWDEGKYKRNIWCR